MKEALDGLQGVRVTHVDLKDDRFDVTHDPTVVRSSDLLRTIRDLGFEPTVVGGHQAAEESRGVISVRRLPPDLAELFAKAEQSGKLVLLHFTGPG